MDLDLSGGEMKPLPSLIVASDDGGQPIDKDGKYVILRIDGYTDFAYASRLAVKELCKRLFYMHDNKTLKAKGEELRKQLQIIEDEVRSKRGRTGRTSNAQSHPAYDPPQAG